MASKIKILCVGKVKEKYLTQGIDEYLKRLRPFVKVEVIELKDEGMRKEAEKISNYLLQNTFVLDEAGKQFSSLEFADMMKKTEGEMVFVIGGAEGIDASIKAKSKMMSLSKMTFVHEMARLFLIEQIYRSQMINNNRNYHK